MKIHILSDIHLEFDSMKIPDVDADITVIAGDLHVGMNGFRWARKFNRPVIYVPGNHEYYGYEMNSLRDGDFKKQKKIHLLDNKALTLDGVNFFGCTLWTDFNYFNNMIVDAAWARTRMNDFKFIRYDKFILSPEDTIKLHKESLAYLRNFIYQKYSKCVIITHHVPSSSSVDSRYRLNALTSAFASNLDELIIDSKVKLWIHGHTHDSFDYVLGETRVVCNPRGYPPFNNNFKKDFVIEI